MRRLGVMLRKAPKNEGGRPQEKTGSRLEPVSTIPTLADIGIDKKTSAVAQQLAALPPEHFEQVREGTITVTRALAAVVRERNAGGGLWGGIRPSKHVHSLAALAQVMQSR